MNSIIYLEYLFQIPTLLLFSNTFFTKEQFSDILAILV